MKACALAILVVLSGNVHAQVAAPATAAAPPASVGVDESARPKVTAQAWTIEVKRSAKADGTLRFRLWRDDMPPVDVAVPVKQGQTDRAIALDLRNAFRDLLGTDFREDVAAGFVQLRALRGERRFGIELVEPVLGVDIELTRR
jgi:hypothetical protein